MNHPSDDRDVMIKLNTEEWVVGYHDTRWMPECAYATYDYCVGDYEYCKDCTNSMCRLVYPIEWNYIMEK